MGAQPLILVADDEPRVTKLVSIALSEEGFRVVTASTGPEALKMAEEHRPDVILMDIVMPGMDGIEVARLAAQKHPGLRIMFITGFAAVALNPDSKAPKDAKVLSKPFHLKDLVAEVERVIAAA